MPLPKRPRPHYPLGCIPGGKRAAPTRALRRHSKAARAGLHIGEIQQEAGDVHGLAVHIAARIGALAGPGEVLVSSTVSVLVLGSGLS